MRVVNVVAACVIVSGVTLSADSQNDWRRVERLTRGDVFTVETTAGARVRGQLIRADADSLLLYAPAVETPQLKPIEQLIRRNASLLEEVGRQPLLLQDSGLRIGTGDVSRNGVHVAAFEEVFAVIARADVVSVVRPKDQRVSYLATIAGVAIGAGVGGLGAFHFLFSDNPCQPHCLIVPAGLFFGSATLGGVIGNNAGRPHDDEVIYRR